jgi:glycosyltransferase involved in cell wall biosynthesis
MQNTSNNLSTKFQVLPEVEVLLATFNGGKYLKQFLESLKQQEGVKIHLRVSDDGSTDSTLEIVNFYKSEFESCQIFDGPGKGASLNFFSLLDKASFDFIAFADQDDIWLPEHLINSVRRLESDPNPLSMTFCQVIESKNFSKDTEKVWPNIYSSPRLHEIFFQNFARGCTIVFRKELAELIKQKDKDCAIMHDWWIYLVAMTCGSVTFSTDCEVRYRLHANNLVGHGPNFYSRILNFLYIAVGGQWAPWAQLEKLKIQFQDYLLPQGSEDLDWILNIRNLKIRVRFNQIFLQGRRLRKSFFSNFLLKIYLLMS